jgi:hypothetical protein
MYKLASYAAWVALPILKAEQVSSDTLYVISNETKIILVKNLL